MKGGWLVELLWVKQLGGKSVAGRADWGYSASTNVLCIRKCC
jgi:hypothetical protein